MKQSGDIRKMGSGAEPARPKVRFLDRRSPPHIFTLVAVAGLPALSMNIFLPSLPGMAQWFDTDYAVMQLSISGYLAVTGVLQLVIGPLSDRFGRRPVLLWSLAVFLLATVACIFAPNVETFLFFRFCQATVASGMVLSRAIVRDLHPPAQAASMIGYVAMGMAVAPMLAPMLGGAVEQVLDWRGNFAAIIVFGVITLALVWSDLGETNANTSSSLLDQTRSYPELIRSLRFWGYALTNAFTSGAFFAFLGGAPYVASVSLGMEPAELGFYFGFIACGYMMGNFLSARYSTRAGINRMLLAGTLISLAAICVSIALFIAGYVHPLSLFAPILVMGLGNGLTMPNAMAGFLSVRPHLAGSASGLGGALMIGGGAGVSAATGAMLGPETGPYPLLGMMGLMAALSLLATLWVIRVARNRGPLRRTHDAAE